MGFRLRVIVLSIAVMLKPVGMPLHGSEFQVDSANGQSNDKSADTENSGANATKVEASTNSSSEEPPPPPSENASIGSKNFSHGQKFSGSILSMFSESVHAHKNSLMSIVGAILGIVGTSLGIWAAKLRVRLAEKQEESNKLTRRLTGPRGDFPVHGKEAVNRVLLLGIGGVGKTTLIHRLTRHSGLNPRISTKEIRTYSMVHEVLQESSSEVYRIDIDDYRGQNVGDLTAKIAVEDERLPFRSLVLMVDLFPANSKQVQHQRFDLDRIQANEAEWSNAALLAILGQAGNEVGHVCLFINKADLKAGHLSTTAAKAQATDAYGNLIRRLGQVCRGKLFHVTVGSAREDLKVNDLLGQLISASRPLT